MVIKQSTHSACLIGEGETTNLPLQMHSMQVSSSEKLKGVTSNFGDSLQSIRSC